MFAAARLSNGKAQAALGIAYRYGFGLEQDCLKSRHYLLRSTKKCKSQVFKEVIYLFFYLQA